MANDLAVQGFTGCRDALNISERYDPAITLKGLEQGYFESHVGPVSHTILRTYFKRYACCRWIHGSVEALLQITRQQNIPVNEIESVHVETFMQAANLNNLTNPPSIESAQYSVPYCMAIAAVLGEDALSPATSDCLHQDGIIKFAEKITVKRDEKMDSSFPHNSPSRVSVTTAKGTFVVMVEELWGDPDRNLDRADLVAKFKTLACGRLAETQVAQIVSAVEGLRDGKAGPLLNALSST
jgi:2-methylcitrate dehydratase PrpD